MTPPTFVGFNPQYMNDVTSLSVALLHRPARGCVRIRYFCLILAISRTSVHTPAQSDLAYPLVKRDAVVQPSLFQ